MGEASQSPVQELVARALAGEQGSWDDLVERFTPLVLSVVRRQRLSPSDAEDVVQTVWLRLVEHLGRLRDPQALPQYIVQTATHECYRLFGSRRHVVLMDPTGTGLPERDEGPEVDADMLATERQHKLLAALAELPDRQRALLLVLLEDPPPPYEEISRRLDMPIGSIGPTRARALAKLREVAEVLALR
jgi:RNA polymerase sigma factor (sigma-70 family)